MSGKVRVSFLMVIIGVLASVTFLALRGAGPNGAAGQEDCILGEKDQIRVDVDPATPGVQTSITVPSGGTFSILIHVTCVASGVLGEVNYSGYQFKLDFNPTIINALPDDGVDNDTGTEPLENICAPSPCALPLGPIINNVPDVFGVGSVFGGEDIFAEVLSTFLGPVYVTAFQCVSDGTIPLDLDSEQTYLLPLSVHTSVELFGADVTCGPGEPIGPTDTPTATPTPTPVPPIPTITATPTLVPPIPTITPTPTRVPPTITPTMTPTPRITPTVPPTVAPTLTSTPTATATPAITPAPVKGRMTGGGSLSGSGRVTHGFELHCDARKLPNNLQVNWGGGNRFHLENLTSASCSDNPAIDPRPPVAGFDTYVGRGSGRYNGVPGATAKWTFTDAGEPGKDDFARIEIWDAGGNLVLSVSGKLNGGNHQAHR